MPTLPTKENLGRRTIQNTTGLISVGPNPIPGAIQRFGAVLGNVADTQFQAQQRDQAETSQESERLARYEAQRRFLEFEDNWRNTAKTRMESAPVGAEGLSKGIQSEYFKQAGEFLKSLPEPLRVEYDSKLFGLESRLTEAATGFEREEQKRVVQNDLADKENRLANRVSIAGDKASLEAEHAAALKDGEELISNAPLSPVERDERLRAWRKKAAEEFASRLVTVDRQAAKVALGGAPSTFAPEVGDKVSHAVSYFVSRGWTKEQAAGIVGNLVAESSLNTGARNPGDGADGSDSVGIAQWNADRARRLKQFAAENRADWRDYNLQLAFVDHELRTTHKRNGDALRNARTVQEATDIGVMYEGPAGSQNGPRAAMHYDKRLRNAMKAAGVEVSEIDDRFADLSPDEREKYLAEIERDEKQDQVIRRVEIERVVEDAPAAVGSTGSYSGTLPTVERFVEAYGEDGPQRFEQFQAAMQTSRDVFSMQTKTTDEIRGMVEAAKPVNTGEGAALDVARYETLTKAAEATIKARTADPVGYVSQVFPAVKQAWDTVSEDPTTLPTAMRQTVEAQKQIGIPEANIRPLPPTMAATAVKTFKDVTLPETDRISAVTTPLFSSSDPVQQRAVHKQLLEEGLPEFAEGALDVLARGDAAAADRLMRAAMVDPADLPGKPAHTMDEIRQTVTDELLGEDGIADVYYGLSDGSVENMEKARRDTVLLTRAAMYRVRDGEDLRSAVQGAAKDLFGDRDVYLGDYTDEGDGVKARLLIDKEQDTGPLTNLLAGYKNEVGKVLLAASRNRVARMPTVEGAQAIVQASDERSIDEVLEDGYFVERNGGYVFIDPISGDPIAGVDGRPMVFDKEGRGLRGGGSIASLLGAAPDPLPATPTVPVEERDLRDLSAGIVMQPLMGGQ